MLAPFILLNSLHFLISSAEDLFTLNSNKFRIFYEIDGNPQLDACDWSMFSNILKVKVNRFQHPQ